MGHKILFICLSLLVILSCKNTDDCKKEAWVGTYTKLKIDCGDISALDFKETYSLIAGTCSNCLTDKSGAEFKFNEQCMYVVETPGENFSFQLKGNLLMITVESQNCTVTYKKQ